MTLSRTLFAGALLAALAATAAHASSPKFFQATTQADFLKGEVEDLSIDARGQLLLGPALDLVFETPAPFVWTIATAADGTFYLGTGNDGKVYRVGADGKGALFFSSAELEVHALAPAPNGGLYVATSPDGKIYKVDRNGVATTFFSPDEKLHLGAGNRSEGQRLRGDGRKGCRLQDLARRQRHAVLPHKNDACDRAGLRQGRQPARRHRHAWQSAACRSGRQRLRAARHDVSGNPRIAFRRQRHALCHGHEWPCGQARPVRLSRQSSTSRQPVQVARSY